MIVLHQCAQKQISLIYKVTLFLLKAHIFKPALLAFDKNCKHTQVNYKVTFSRVGLTYYT